MKEFVEKLIGRLEEEISWYETHGCNEDLKRGIIGANRHTISIVNQLAEEYNNGWITDRFPTKEECKNNIFWITDSDGWDYEADFDLECKRWRDLENGGFIDVIAWHMLPLPAPFQKGSDE